MRIVCGLNVSCPPVGPANYIVCGLHVSCPPVGAADSGRSRLDCMWAQPTRLYAASTSAAPVGAADRYTWVMHAGTRSWVGVCVPVRTHGEACGKVCTQERHVGRYASRVQPRYNHKAGFGFRDRV